MPIERLDRPTIRKFLTWVYDRAVAAGGTNPGRTSNKARTHLRAVISWAWENDLIDMPPRFPKPIPHNTGSRSLRPQTMNPTHFWMKRFWMALIECLTLYEPVNQKAFLVSSWQNRNLGELPCAILSFSVP